ncbi:MAG: PSD1 domain-containing protein [Pirellulales bacterium]|nr:PSD1 domain-containing protein [Pirellulales bacterium]
MARRFASIACLAFVCFAARVQADEAPDYARDIQPILARSCFRCHGAEKQESGLRLDTADGAREGGYSGAAVIPGQGGDSILVHALTGTHDATQMPPEGEGERLSAAEVTLVTRWIDAGAEIPADPSATSGKSRRTSEHWSFQPVVRPELPVLRRPAWVRTPIDAFVLAELERRSLAPAPEADRATLIRRVSLDLIGLPPSPAEVEAFLLDNRADAYERVVDRLLASPHYGERWGRHWLDLARYADSNGYTIDSARSIWKYRDWVIAAMNRDLPFDQFAIEQLAGDMLPEATLEQRIATGFHRNTLKNEEGGTDPEQFRVEAVADRVATTGAVFLGLTIGCARCHDHKYDPLSQRDYYQMFALFNSADEPSLQVPTDQQSKELPALAADLVQAQQRLKMVDENAPGRQADWEKKLAGRVGRGWQTLEPVEYHSAHGATLEKLADLSLLATGERPRQDEYIVEVELPLGEPLTAIRLEALTDDRLPRRGPGRAGNGNFVLSEVTITRLPPATAEVAESAQAATGSATPTDAAETMFAIASTRADHSQVDYPIAAAADGDTATGWAINVARGSMNVDRTAIFVLSQVLEPAEQGSRLRITLRHQHRDAGYTLGRFRLSATSTATDLLGLSPAALAALAIPAEQRSDEQRETLRIEYQQHDPERLPLAAAIEELKRQQKQLESSITTTLALAERSEPRPTTIHIRGDFLRPGSPVAPDVPEVLPPLEKNGERGTRLDFARWLVDGRNPLTARVTVNRLWQQYFGVGLVATENDFGTQGDPPTHPALLDWLSSEFVRNGWSQKAIHRLIVTSAAYRQSSRFRPELVDVDADNKLLARQSRLRLDAEAIRDSALAASGLLAREIGGPGVYPPQPEGIYAFTQQVKYWKESQGPDRFRRAMYTYFWRSSPYPFLTTFDVPDANTACTRRVRSNTPLQSLTLANDRAFQEIARGLATRVIEHLPEHDDAARIRYAIKLGLAREPSMNEQATLGRFVAEQRASFAADRESAASALGVTAEAGAADPQLAERATWTALARVLLNLDEFVTRE